jgi:hypothetical protein
MINKDELSWYIHVYRKVEIVASVFACSTITISKYMRKYNITTPKGFYSTGIKIGRPKGIPMKNAQKELFSKLFKGSNNPFYGKKHSKEVKKKMSLNHADFNGDKNPFKKSLNNPCKLQAHKERCKAIWAERNSDWRKKFKRKVSLGLAKSNKLNNKNCYKYHKSGHINTNKAGKIFVRSSWERMLAEFLDKCEYVERFSLEGFYISYININGQTRFSRIDFMVYLYNYNTIMLEVKPKNLINYKNNIYKIRGYKKYCKNNGIRFAVITEDLIFNEQLLISVLKNKNGGS